MVRSYTFSLLLMVWGLGRYIRCRTLSNCCLPLIICSLSWYTICLSVLRRMLTIPLYFIILFRNSLLIFWIWSRGFIEINKCLILFKVQIFNRFMNIFDFMTLNTNLRKLWYCCMFFLFEEWIHILIWIRVITPSHFIR